MSETEPLLVACLCAAWCRTCTDYAPGFEALAADVGAAARFVHIDIEDEAELLGDIDVVDFPTLLIARGPRVLFFGPVLPNAQTARRLVEGALQGALAPTGDAQLDALAARLRGFPG